jgi:K+-transporting ATPase ATPase B chain
VDFTSSEAVRKGAEHAVRAWAEPAGDDQLTRIVADIARTGGTPLIIARNRRLLGAVHLKDTVKPDIRERFRQLRIMGVRTLMVTGDNPLTAASIAAEAGVDDVVANATPEIKLEIIRKYQAEGRIVAMCGDGADDAPALAQADVGLAVNDGAPAAKTAANLIALDGDPTKLIDAIRIARQSSIARGALITFSVTGTAAKIFILTPTLFTPIYPGLESLNLIGLASASSGVISAAIFNVMAILALTPLVLKGAGYHPARVETMLARNLLIYGVGGIAAPFLGIKLIDLIIVQLGIV